MPMSGICIDLHIYHMQERVRPYAPRITSVEKAIKQNTPHGPPARERHSDATHGMADCHHWAAGDRCSGGRWVVADRGGAKGGGQLLTLSGAGVDEYRLWRGLIEACR